jgi:hypothetical protein
LRPVCAWLPDSVKSTGRRRSGQVDDKHRGGRKQQGGDRKVPPMQGCVLAGRGCDEVPEQPQEAERHHGRGRQDEEMISVTRRHAAPRCQPGRTGTCMKQGADAGPGPAIAREGALRTDAASAPLDRASLARDITAHSRTPPSPGARCHSDLPVEQPARYETHVNLKAAKALGPTISQSLLRRAD